MFTIAQISKAHQKVKSGADFPNYIKEIKKLGVKRFETFVEDSHTVYYGEEGYQKSSPSKYEPLIVDSQSNKQLFKAYLKTHQQGATDYFTFCKHCAETGIEKWIVDLDKMTCVYYDTADNKILVEQIPEA